MFGKLRSSRKTISSSADSSSSNFVNSRPSMGKRGQTEIETTIFREVSNESGSAADSGKARDDELLQALGYKAELKREFNKVELFGVSFSIMSVAPSIASVLSNQLPAGGVGLSWGWLVPCFFIMSISITMSEMASSMPTAGGLYWWTYHYAPDKWKSYLSFLCGYTDTLGLIAGVASINYGAAQQVLASVTMANGYLPSRSVTFAVYAAILVLEGFLGFVPSKFFAKFQNVTITLNLAAVGIVCIALPIGMKHKGMELNSGEFIFSDTTNFTSYPYGISFLLSWMAAIWSISSQDSCVHLAEEASNAASAVPFGILTATGVCSILGFAMTTVLAACIDSSEEGMQNLMEADSPIAVIIQRALNEQWSTGIMSLFAFIQFTMGLTALISCSRQVYAFARDDALPFSRIIKQTSKSQLPIAATIFSLLVSVILGLLIFGGNVAADAIFTLCNAALYLGWCLPIFVYAFSNKRIERPGPFYLGHFWSKLNAIVASAYGAFVIFFLAMIPVDVPVKSPNDMNFSCLVCGTVWIAASLYWLIDARKWYHGPKSTVEKDFALCEVIEAEEWDRAEKQKAEKEIQSSKAEF